MREARWPSSAETRPFGLLDMMILVVVSAPSMVVLRERYEHYRGPTTPQVYRTVDAFYAGANTLLMAATLALAVMVLTRARSVPMLAQPGPAACLAAAAAIVVTLARMSIKAYAMFSGTGNPFQFRYIYPHIVSGWSVRVGFAVLGAWVAVLLTRRWRPRHSWLDRAGRALGWAWIAIDLLHLLLPWVEAYLPAI
jgi:hypothetical protein